MNTSDLKSVVAALSDFDVFEFSTRVVNSKNSQVFTLMGKDRNSRLIAAVDKVRGTFSWDRHVGLQDPCTVKWFHGETTDVDEALNQIDLFARC